MGDHTTALAHRNNVIPQCFAWQALQVYNNYNIIKRMLFYHDVLFSEKHTTLTTRCRQHLIGNLFDVCRLKQRITRDCIIWLMSCERVICDEIFFGIWMQDVYFRTCNKRDIWHSGFWEPNNFHFLFVIFFVKLGKFSVCIINRPELCKYFLLIRSLYNRFSFIP